MPKEYYVGFGTFGERVIKVKEEESREVGKKDIPDILLYLSDKIRDSEIRAKVKIEQVYKDIEEVEKRLAALRLEVSRYIVSPKEQAKDAKQKD